MSQIIKIKRRGLTDGAPNALAEGELAANINGSPAQLWIGGPDGATVIPINEPTEDAPTDAIYGRTDGAWVRVPIQDDAPSNANHYVRYQGAWTVLPSTGGISHAVSDGSYYASRNGAWTVFTPGISHAASTSQYYGSYNGAWQVITAAGLGITLAGLGGISHATSNNIYYSSRNGAWTADPIQSDAASTNQYYGRYNGTWQIISAAGLGITLAGLGGIGHATANSVYYGSYNGSWQAVPIQSDAPAGAVYGRTSGSWSRAVAVAGDTMTGTLNGTSISLSGNLSLATSSQIAYGANGVLSYNNALNDLGYSAITTVFESLVFSRNFRCGGALRSTAGSLWIGSDNSFGMFQTNIGSGSQTSVLRMSNNMAFLLDYVTASWAFHVLGFPVGSIDSGGALKVAQGWKPGGGLWTDSSDSRIKQTVGHFTRGLAAIESLVPVVYKFLGNDSDRDEPAPYGHSPHRMAAEAGTEYIGLVAQEAEGAFPELVSKSSGYIDGEKVDDLRTLDETPLVFGLINAVKELSAQVRALTARVQALEAS